MYYVIPDIHGNYDLLSKALDEIYSRQDSGKIIFLGDYIDRGNKNRLVLETVMNPPENWEFICLKGNHEDMFIGAYNGEHEYYDPRVLLEWDEFPVEILNWMKNLPLFHFENENIFAHAYYDLRLSPESQKPNHVLWVRFADHTQFGYGSYYLTHGHTPRSHGPIEAPFRMNLDCCVFGENPRLCVGVYEENRMRPVELLDFT